MDKLYAVARLLGVALAIVSAFVAIPNAAAALLVLGAVAAIGNDMDRNVKLMLGATVLILGAKMLEAIPAVGVPLAAIFANVATAFVGASVMAITLLIVTRVKTDWVK
jgi:hypothetical protein